MKYRIKALLKKHKGKGNAITAIAIANTLNIRVTGTALPIRVIIKELVEKDRIPIGSCRQGFYFIETEAERREAVNNLINRVISITHRIVALRDCVL